MIHNAKLWELYCKADHGFESPVRTGSSGGQPDKKTARLRVPPALCGTSQPAKARASSNTLLHIQPAHLPLFLPTSSLSVITAADAKKANSLSLPELQQPKHSKDEK